MLIEICSASRHRISLPCGRLWPNTNNYWRTNSLWTHHGLQMTPYGRQFQLFSLCGLEMNILVLLEYDIVSFFVSLNSYVLRSVQLIWNNLKIVKMLVVPERSHCTLLTHSCPHCVTLTSLLFFSLGGTAWCFKMVSNLATVLSL